MIPTTSDAHRRVRILPAGVLAYGCLFAIVLPVALAAWAHRLDSLLSLPAVGSWWLGATVAAMGIVLMAAAGMGLWFDGGGLPMSPYPPARLVVRGAYRLVADPIYVGGGLLCGGVALMTSSAAGLWVVTPVVALAAVAFVLGYERDATRARFGASPLSLLRLPAATDGPPTGWERAAVYVLVFLPWLALYEAASRLGGAAPDARSTYMAWEARLTTLPWTEAVNALAYPIVLLVPMLARRREDLHRFAWLGILATCTIIPVYLLVPMVAPARPVPGGSFWSPLMRLERHGDQAATALPAFRAVWALIACEVYVTTWPRLRWAAIFAAGAIAASCVTAGMHGIVDVLAGLVAYVVIARFAALWTWCCRGAERVANSWREWRIGPVRMMSHGVYAAGGGAVGVAVAVWVAGPETLWWIVALAIAAEVGAALWAQVVEGSPQLLRPYGYFGSVVAVALLCAGLGALGHNGWLLLSAMAVGGCFTQVLGRLRCLVQGCCHGRPTEESWGLRYRHERSRVVRLSHLGGVPLHPTQVYSVVWTTFTGLVLIRLWTLAAPLSFITGSYLVLVGLGRFVEEHYRGEPQTAWVAGLRLYQWLAIVFVIVGAGLTALGGAPAPRPSAIGVGALPALALVAVVTYVAYGVDFPGASRRFSRLI